jgi:hypothetical protein
MTKAKPSEAENGERHLSQISLVGHNFDESESAWNYASTKVVNDVFFCLENSIPRWHFHAVKEVPTL